MLFKVFRTSTDYGVGSENQVKPCPEAERKKCFQFITEGIGYEEFWCIEFKTLEELIAFQEKYGKLIIDYDRLEIYDVEFGNNPVCIKE